MYCVKFSESKKMYCSIMHRKKSLRNFLLVILFIFLHICRSSAFVEVSTQDLSFEVNDKATFSVYLSLSEYDNIRIVAKNLLDSTVTVMSPESQRSAVPVYIRFNYSEGSNLVPLPNNFFIPNGTLENVDYNVTAHRAGHTTVIVNATPTDAEQPETFVRVGVYKINALNTVSAVIGWLYFICWSISFYPQIIDNWRRKSVVGLNFDFLGLNLTGFIAYSVFNIGLRFVPEVKAEYHSLHPTGVIPVEINDVVFAVQAVIATAITIGQCFCYERGDQMISKITVAVLALVWSAAAVFLLVTALELNKNTPWLTFLYFFSYVKLGVTLTKYMPQVYYNYQRKSTEGWSIGTVLLDFIGGLFSISQMFIIAYNFDDWFSIFGNFTKFGLGIASVTFDVIFMIQHYCLYRERDSDSLQSTLIK